jgi:hypothetical protein
VLGAEIGERDQMDAEDGLDVALVTRGDSVGEGIDRSWRGWMSG